MFHIRIALIDLNINTVFMIDRNIGVLNLTDYTQIAVLEADLGFELYPGFCQPQFLLLYISTAAIYIFSNGCYTYI